MLGAYFEQTNDLQGAIDCYERALDVDDLNEEFYYRCIKCHARLGQKSEAIAVYERCKKVQSFAPGSKPSLEIENLINAIMSEG